MDVLTTGANPRLSALAQPTLANPPSNNNPLFYRTVVREPNPAYDKDHPGLSPTRDRTVIHSMLDTLFVGQRIPNSEQYVEQIGTAQHLTINALDLVLCGTLQVPCGDVRIFCRRLMVHAASGGAVIDVAPLALAPPYEHCFAPKSQAAQGAAGEDGDRIAELLQKGEGHDFTGNEEHDAYVLYGTPGQDAGTITIVCDELCLGDALHLQAPGGKGYPGSDGQQGGPAADSVHGMGGHGGRAGRGGAGGKGGTLTLRYRAVDHQPQLSWNNAAGEPGISGAPGEPGLPRGERGGENEPGGSRGAGDVDEDNGIELSELGALFDDVYLRRLVQKCKLTYLFNQPSKFTEAEIVYPPAWKELGDLLNWTCAVLAGYTTIADEEKASLRELRLNSLYQWANNLQMSYQGGLTYDNSAPDLVQSTPLDKMVAEFDRCFDARQALESKFLALSAAFDSAQQAQHALDDARAVAGKQKALHKDTYDALYNQLTTDLPKTVNAARAAFEAAKTRAHTELQRFSKKVSEHYSQCSLEDVLKAASTLAFTAGDPKAFAASAAVEVASMVNDGFNKLPTNDGQKISKADVVDELVAVDGGLEDVARGELFELVDGKAVFKSRKKLLITQIQKLRDEVAGLSKTMEPSNTDPVLKALDDFTDALYDQGQALLLYNIVAARMVDEYRSYLRADGEANALDSTANPLSPGWVGNVSFFSKLYQDALEATAIAVAKLQRKAAYVTLDYRPPTDWLGNLGSLWLDGKPPMPSSMNDFRNAVNDLCRLIGSHASDQPSAAKRIPVHKNTRSELFVDLTPVLLEQFKKRRVIASDTSTDTPERFDGYGVTFTVVRSRTNESATDQVVLSNASRLFDVRVDAVQPRIIGARTHSGTLAVEAQAAARMTIYDEDDRAHTFRLGRTRSTGVVHKLSTRLSGETYDDSGSGSGGQLNDDYLDRMGVYGKWRLWCPEPETEQDANAGLDVSQVTQIRVYFDVYAHHKTVPAR